MVSTNTRSFYSSPGPVALRCAAALCLSTRNALFCLIQRPQGTPKGATCISRPLPAHHAAANLAHHHASDRPCQDLPSHLLLNLTVLVDRPPPGYLGRPCICIHYVLSTLPWTFGRHWLHPRVTATPRGIGFRSIFPRNSRVLSLPPGQTFHHGPPF